ncbi:hypothetical protein ACGFT2_20700 [Streptomyces sp. NPDC048514]|uniref:hypothetical protein n=1 Tax=Streptomyces sp. NPDC048514 TaxID=3365564 RepID=UPI003716E133
MGTLGALPGRAGCRRQSSDGDDSDSHAKPATLQTGTEVLVPPFLTKATRRGPTAGTVAISTASAPDQGPACNRATARKFEHHRSSSVGAGSPV